MAKPAPESPYMDKPVLSELAAPLVDVDDDVVVDAVWLAVFEPVAVVVETVGDAEVDVPVHEYIGQWLGFLRVA